MPLPKAVDDERRRAAGDRAVGDVERRIVPVAPMEQQEVDDVAERKAVVQIAKRATDDQCQAGAVQTAATALQQPQHQPAGGDRDRGEQPALPSAFTGEEAERRPGVERQHEAEERRERNFLAGTERRENRGLRHLVEHDDRDGDP